MGSKKFTRRCLRYISGEMTEEESLKFYSTIEDNEKLKKLYEEYQMIWNCYPELTNSKDLSTNQKHNRLNLTLSSIKKYSGIAASIVILIGFSIFYYVSIAGYKKVQADLGQRLSVVLPDSSVVILNSGGTIKYKTDFSKKRKVELKGEGYFKVKHDPKRAFIVQTKNLDVCVHGTQFDVNTNNDNEEVSLVKGKVSVKIRSDQKEYVLKPKEQFLWNSTNKTYSEKRFDVDFVTSWKDNMLKFNSVVLKDAIQKINNFYGVSFAIGDSHLDKQIVKGTFKNMMLNEFITTLEFIGDFKIKNKGGNEYLIFKKNGSN